jgi:hypothetical protein
LTLNISNSDILQFVWFSNVVLLFFLNLLWMSHAMPKKLVIWWKSHVFILAYIVNIILDWLINKGIITCCFSYWPSYRPSVCCICLRLRLRPIQQTSDLWLGQYAPKANTADRGPMTRPIWKTSRNNTIIFTFQTGSLHMTLMMSCWLCSKVVNNISRNFFSLQSYVYSP